MTPDLKLTAEAIAAEMLRQNAATHRIQEIGFNPPATLWTGCESAEFDLEAVARAALEAIREPSEEVWDVVGREDAGYGRNGVVFVTRVWRDVLDQILKSPG